MPNPVKQAQPNKREIRELPDNSRPPCCDIDYALALIFSNKKVDCPRICTPEETIRFKQNYPRSTFSDGLA